MLERYETPGSEPGQLMGKAAQTAEIEAAKFIQTRDTLGILSSSYLDAAAAGFALRAREDEQAAERGAVNTGGEELAMRLADALKGKDLGALIVEWDPNKDAHISKLEFRVGVRKLLDRGGYACCVPDLDALFEEIDVDQSGGVSLPELKAAVKRLSSLSKLTQQRAVSLGESAAMYKRLALHTRRVAEITRLLEHSVAELEAVTDASRSLVKNSSDTKHSNVGKGSLNQKTRPSKEGLGSRASHLEGNAVGAQLGALMVRKGLRAESIVETWDASGDGLLQMGEFRKEVLKLGVTCGDPKEVDDLFRLLDTDGGGSLDLGEVREALKTLEAEAFAARKGVRGLSGRVVELLRAAKAAQTEWKQERKQEDDAVAKEAAMRQQEAAGKAAAEAEKAAAKEARQAARKAAAATKKALMDQKVAAIRGKASDATAAVRFDATAAVADRLRVTAAKLKLRATKDVDSEDVGSVAEGLSVVVVDMTTLADGTQRACITLDENAPPVGWVTMFSKDGDENLL